MSSKYSKIVKSLKPSGKGFELLQESQSVGRLRGLYGEYYAANELDIYLKKHGYNDIELQLGDARKNTGGDIYIPKPRNIIIEVKSAGSDPKYTYSHLEGWEWQISKNQAVGNNKFDFLVLLGFWENTLDVKHTFVASRKDCGDCENEWFDNTGYGVSFKQDKLYGKLDKKLNEQPQDFEKRWNKILDDIKNYEE